MDWEKQQNECKKCQGCGYRHSEARHESGRGPAWSVLCECQPHTLAELKEAAAQEKQLIAAMRCFVHPKFGKVG